MRLLLSASSLCVLCAALSACSDAEVDSPPDVPDADVAQMEVSVEGATIKLDGTTASLELQIPPGALLAPVEITIRHTEAPTGTFASFLLEPKGLVFEEPVSLTIESNEAAPRESMRITMGAPAAPIYFPTSGGARGQFATTIRAFGIVDEPIVGLLTAQILDPQENAVRLAAATCGELIQAGERTITELSQNGRLEQAGRAATFVSAILQEMTCGAEADAFLSRSVDLVCSAYKDAVITAEASLIDDFGVFSRVASPLIALGANAQLVGDDCVARDLGELLGEKLAQFLTFYNPEAAALGADDFENFQSLHEEAVGLVRIMGQTSVLGASDIADQLRTDGLHPVMNLLRDNAFRVVQSGAEHYFLARLTSDGLFQPRRILLTNPPAPTLISTSGIASFSDADVVKDLQYAATDVRLQSSSASGTPKDAARFGTNGEPGRFESSPSLAVDSDGTVTLSGTLRSLSCWRSASSMDEIVVLLDGQEIDRIATSTSGDFLSSEYPLAIGALASRAGIALTEGSRYELTFRRVRPLCPECECPESRFGPLEIDLAKVDLVVRRFLVLPDEVTLRAGASQIFRAQLSGVDEAVTWSADGGSIDPTGFFVAGDTAGTFQVTATSTNDPSLVASGLVTVDATPVEPRELAFLGMASCFDIDRQSASSPSGIYVVQTGSRLEIRFPRVVPDSAEPPYSTDCIPTDAVYVGTLSGRSFTAVWEECPSAPCSVEGMLTDDMISGHAVWQSDCECYTDFTATIAPQCSWFTTRLSCGP